MSRMGSKLSGSEKVFNIMIQSKFMLGNLNTNPQLNDIPMIFCLISPFNNYWTSFFHSIVQTTTITQLNDNSSVLDEYSPKQDHQGLNSQNEKSNDLPMQKYPSLKAQIMSVCETPIFSQQIKISNQQDCLKRQSPPPSPKVIIPTDSHLQFRIDWKNQNRNIVPNVINQIISFLIKKGKSSKQITKIFRRLDHDSRWTSRRFYQYMKGIKNSIPHYVTEDILGKFFEIHQQNYQIYCLEEQEFYMKVCRIAVRSFLSNDAVINALISARMDVKKRKTHLIARQALEKKFIDLCRYREN